ncbi:MAG: tryptophan synthase subunit alpha [Crocinitomicaceae bacterium]|nr:tryptophan synthase subunit alpha [Crocinitomicaceae bacterium]
MDRLKKMFENTERKVLSIYFTAGYPQLNDTETIILELEKNGVDLIEIGIPFSDPLADGPIIQQSSYKAIENGMTLKLLFEQLKDIRQKTQIPLVLMGYLNSVIQFGEDEFCRKCVETGIDGVILPDLPLEYYEMKYQRLFKNHGLNLIMLISPQTSIERIQKIDAVSSGFLYLVSSNSITGGTENLGKQREYFKRISDMQLNNPTLAGFGIHDKESFEIATENTNGAIIGSAFIKSLEDQENLEKAVAKFLSPFKIDQCV